MIGGKLPVEIKNLLKEKGVSEKDVVMFEEVFNKNPEDMVEKIIEKLKEKGESEKDIRLFIDALNVIVDYEQLEVEHYTFKELLAWLKDKFDENKHSFASVTKTLNDNKIILVSCFLDKNKEALIMGEPYLKVTTNSICEDFINNFDGKEMIIIEF